jgi:hypothetical protein
MAAIGTRRGFHPTGLRQQAGCAHPSRHRPGPRVPAACHLADAPGAVRDEAGESRRQGGIHFPDADHNGRTLGTSVGQNTLEKAQTYFDGTAPTP